MEYRYLREWVLNHGKKSINCIITDIKGYQDSLAVLFKGRSQYLQIILQGTNPFLFFTDKKQLPFRSEKNLENFSRHLSHSLIKDVSIQDNDRLIFFNLEKVDIYNKVNRYSLIIELIPHRENLILTKHQGDNDIVIDCRRYLTLSANSTRQILPGSRYELPVSFISETDIDKDRGKDQLNADYFKPVHFPIYFSELVSGKYVLPAGYEDRPFDNVNDLFETFFYEVIIPQRLRRIRDDKIKQLSKQKERREKKLAKLQREYEESKKSDRYKKMAELLKVNLHRVRQGMSEISVTDYYTDEEKQISIPLRKDLGPVENMKSLFKKYRKGSSGREKIKEQISKTEEEIDRYESEIFELENGIMDLIDIEKQQNEKRNLTSRAKHKKQKDRFRRLKVDNDREIFIGRTNRENDLLTTRYARPDDWWFHTRMFHGAHIVLRKYNRSELTPELTKICCGLAAYFSKAKNSENVPVDYTRIRYVTKPHGSAPGYVIYKNHKTMYVNPISLREAAQIIND